MVGTITYSSAANTITCVGGTAGAPITFKDLCDANDLNGWRVVEANGTNQFIFNCKIQIGDGNTATYLIDTNKQVVFVNAITGNYQIMIEVKSAATLTLGTLVDANTKSTSSGCCIIKTSAFADYIIDITGTTGAVNLFSTNILSTQVSRFNSGTVGGSAAGNFKVYNCLFSMYVNLWYVAVFDAYRLTIQTAAYAFDQALNGTFSDISITNPYYSAVYLAVQSPVTSTIKNLNCYASTVATFNSAALRTLYLINPVCSTWAFQFTTVGICYVQYEFGLFTDPSATVTLTDNLGATVFSVTSNPITGVIATQTVSRGYYDQAHGNALQDYGPFTLTITKIGKMPYTQTGIILTDPIIWYIQLRDQLSGTADVGDVAATKTFYKDDADSKLTGTLALTGDADAGDVKVGKKFYKDNLAIQLTGSLDQSDATAAEDDIIAGKTAYVNFIKKTGTFIPVAGGGPQTVIMKADPEEIVFVDGKPALLIDEKDPEIYTFICKKNPR